MRFSAEALAGQSEDVTRLAQEISDQMDEVDVRIDALVQRMTAVEEAEGATAILAVETALQEQETVNAKLSAVVSALSTGTIEERIARADAMLAAVADDAGGDPA